MKQEDTQKEVLNPCVYQFHHTGIIEEIGLAVADWQRGDCTPRPTVRKRPLGQADAN